MEWVASGDRNEKDTKTQSEKELAHQLNFPIGVEIEEKDPSAEFLKRFADVPREVRAVSCRTIARALAPMGVIDKLTGRPAIRFYIGNVKGSGEASAVVPAGDDCDGLSAPQAGLTQ
jgi:hypothetical protein